MQPISRTAIAAVCAAGIAAGATTPAHASSHMDAPLITFDDPANTTDVYAFRSRNQDGGVQYLTTALAVYPFEEPGIGPNNYRFDDRVRYEIHVALDKDVDKGRPTLTYRFDFDTKVKNRRTVLQSFLGVIDDDPSNDENGFDPNLNLRQSYQVTVIDHRRGSRRNLGRGVVPPNNQGLVTPFYNQGDDGAMPAKGGVAASALLDPYTRSAIADLRWGYRSFAGQRDDGFYADIQSIFDLDFAFAGPNKPFDSQGGFNVHTIVLDIPMEALGEAKRAGVFATTSRRLRVAGDDRDDWGDDWEGWDDDRDDRRGNRDRRYGQVGRQGNPLFAEALIAGIDKDRYNRTRPDRDERRFGKYVENVELANVLGTVPNIPLLAQIFLPDLIKVDLTTGPAATPNHVDFSRLSVFGGDVLVNANGETVAGGWPNGRRFGDDVLDIALLAIGVPPPNNNPAEANFDGIDKNDITYNDVFPYAATPLNGRGHGHHDQSATLP